MAGSQFDSLLNKILEHAKQVGGVKTENVTLERFIVAMIDYASDAGISDVSLRERKKLMDTLKEYFPFAKPDFSDVKADFLAHIGNRGGLSFVDGLYMQQLIRQLSVEANEKGVNCLTSDMLIKGIFDNPNNFIRDYSKARNGKTAKEESKEEAPDPISELISRLNKLVDEKAAGDNDDARDNEPKEKDEHRGRKHEIAELTKKVKAMHDKLSARVLGQENAVNVFTAGYFSAELLEMTGGARNHPKATFLFAGPPGVGKTKLAEEVASLLDMPFKRFDMSEYCDKEASLEFIGSDNVYKGSKKGNFTEFVEENPKSVILLDEIEKAHISIIHLFLQILDAGRIRDSKTDQELSLEDTILIFTTNAGKQLYNGAETGDFSCFSRKVIINALQKDVDQRTGTPFFPEALCSRFASGNVVMFNRLSADVLRKIAKLEVLRLALDFEKETGIKVEVDEQVYTALLFAESGNCDGRTISSRAGAFFNSELFELFRLMSSESNKEDIRKIDSISIKAELPTDDPGILSLFRKEEKHRVLLVASDKTAEQCAKLCGDAEFICASTSAKAKRQLKDTEVSYALVDLSFGRSAKSRYLNTEDVSSTARDIMWYIRENHPDVPVYILQNGYELNPEERISFLRQGIRGYITLSDDAAEFAASIKEVGAMLHQQYSVDELAKANKLLTFETAQRITDRGKKAEIILFDFETEAAVDAEDSKNVLANLSRPDVRFDQVIGAEDAKKELMYFVNYLRNPKKFAGSGLSAPKGILLYGPPGTGKTMLAKAMACESGVTFINAQGNQFLKKYVGEGPEKVHELFKTARKYAPSVVFIDEIDAIAKERTGEDNSGAEAILTALLTEMDGFAKDPSKPVFVLAATNFDVTPGSGKSLDQALMRRFDRRLFIDLPTRDERAKYLHMKTDGKSTFELSEEEINSITIRSTGMSLAGLESVLELSLRMAVRDGKMKVTDAILDEAFESFNGGEVKKWNPSTLERVARHEAGHALLCWLSGEKPSYLTIVARGGHGGYMQHDDNEDKPLVTRSEMRARIRTSLGGRAAEMVCYGDEDGVSSGASGDLEQATSYAMRYLCALGMDEEFGLAVVNPQAAVSGELSREVREKVNRILYDEMQLAIAEIMNNRTAFDMMVNLLLQKNHLSGDEIDAVFSKYCEQ